jgi:hypothetical protein
LIRIDADWAYVRVENWGRDELGVLDSLRGRTRTWRSDGSFEVKVGSSAVVARLYGARFRPVAKRQTTISLSGAELEGFLVSIGVPGQAQAEIQVRKHFGKRSPRREVIRDAVRALKGNKPGRR